jgi:Caspase domain
LWDIASGKLLARVITFQSSNDWILITPDGRFDGSQGGLKQLYYVKGQEVIPLEQLYEGFYTPGLTKQVLAGTVSESKRDMKNIKSPPSVKITYEPSKVLKELLLEGQTLEATIDKPTAQITIEATAPDDVVDEIRIYHNGKLIVNKTRNLIVEDEKAGADKKVITIDLVEGENLIKAVALNSQRTESKPDAIILTYKPVKTSNTRPTMANDITLHMIVVGINKYKNPKYNLNYATADATSFKEAIEKSGSSIFAKTNIVFIGDEKATKEGISSELDKIKATATAKDVFIFYYAGHGVLNQNKDFFLVPYDVTQLYGNDDALAQRGLSANHLQQFSKDIKAQKQLFILDACQSAGALDQVMASRGAAEEKAIAQLARATGTHWLTASGSEQFASEFTQLGHGTFTFVLLEALSGKADKGGDKKITVKELDAYLQEQVPELTAKYKGTPQYPASYGFGNDFPIGVVKN